MKASLSWLGVLGLLVPMTGWSYGEGDVPYEARVMHFLMNEARSDVPVALAQCGSNCLEGMNAYVSHLHPVWWQPRLYQAAQFHAVSMNYMDPNKSNMKLCLSHSSPCQLDPSAASTGCKGEAWCACVDKKGKCGSNGTPFERRVQMFYPNAHGEIIGVSTEPSPFSIFYSYLYENGKQTKEHRAEILSKDVNRVGVGFSQGWSVGDFGSEVGSGYPITSGSDFKEDSSFPVSSAAGSGKTWFRLHYFNPGKPIKQARLYFNDRCYDLQSFRGTSENGSFGTMQIQMGRRCTPYFYEVQDSMGNVYRYPESGFLQYSCDHSWRESWQNGQRDKRSCFGENAIMAGSGYHGSPNPGGYQPAGMGAVSSDRQGPGYRGAGPGMRPEHHVGGAVTRVREYHLYETDTLVNGKVETHYVEEEIVEDKDGRHVNKYEGNGKKGCRLGVN